MFERYTERARRLLFFARYEASQLGSISIESEHLLLGLAREGKGLTSRIFARRHIDLNDVRRQIESRTVYREKVSTSVEIPFSPDAKAIFQHAADEADRLRHTYIGTEHLLLGILRAEGSAAASILGERGLRLQEVRDEIAQLLADRDPVVAMAPAAHPVGAGPPHVPAYLPSDTVHISLTTQTAPGVWFSESPRHWHITGADLTALLARAYRTDESRVVVPADLTDDRRYDVVLLLPADESAAAIGRRVQEAVAQQFQIAVTREMRSVGEVLLVAGVKS